jgi:hypothetical protein
MIKARTTDTYAMKVAYRYIYQKSDFVKNVLVFADAQFMCI